MQILASAVNEPGSVQWTVVVQPQKLTVPTISQQVAFQASVYIETPTSAVNLSPLFRSAELPLTEYAVINNGMCRLIRGRSWTETVKEPHSEIIYNQIFFRVLSQ